MTMVLAMSDAAMCHAPRDIARSRQDETIKRGDVRSVGQLQLSLKTEAPAVKDVFFRRQVGCYIAASNEGGQWEDEHSPEACAQLCMADTSCKSFDAGR